MSKLLTVKEVAERLRLHPMTVRRHIKSGRLKATRIGRAVRVSEDALVGATAPRGPGSDWKAELLAWITRPMTEEEIERRREAGERIRELRDAQPVSDIRSDVLVRAARRGDEVSYGEKTWEELIAEESEPLGD